MGGSVFTQGDRKQSDCQTGEYGKKLIRRNIGAAINSFDVFINNVEAERGEKTSEDKADDLLDTALATVVILEYI